MKTTVKHIALVFAAAITLWSCTPNDEEVEMATPSLQAQLPENGKAFSGDDTLHPVTFRWTPIVPKPQPSVTYRLKVWQLMQGQNGTQAMRDNQPKVVKTVRDITETTVTGIYTGPCRPPYLCDFIWTVEALSQGENGTVISYGTSNPSVFYF